MQTRFLTATLLALITLLVSPFALAHTGAGHTAGLADGFMHPVTGLDHLLVAVAAGFWSAGTGKQSLRVVMMFLLLLLAGMLLGGTGLVFPQLGVGTILAFLLPVPVIAVAIARQDLFARVSIGSFVFYHGVVHIQEMPSPVSINGYAVGLLLSTGVLLALGIILRQVIITRKPHHHISHG